MVKKIYLTQKKAVTEQWMNQKNIRKQYVENNKHVENNKMADVYLISNNNKWKWIKHWNKKTD